MTVSKTDHYYLSSDATPIHHLRYHVEGTPKANLLIIHGAGEYAERYDEFARASAAVGLETFAIDLRGFGQSGGTRAFVKRIEVYAGDIKPLVLDIIPPKQPLFVFGHSFGGLVASLNTADWLGERISGLILSSPCFQIALKIPRPLKLLGQCMSLIYPKFLHKTPDDLERLTHDVAIAKAHREDPRVLRASTSRLYTEILKHTERYPEIAKGIQCPLWIGQAGADMVVNADVSKRFCNLAASHDKTFKLYPGLYHEILNEIERKTVIRDIHTWIFDRLK